MSDPSHVLNLLKICLAMERSIAAFELNENMIFSDATELTKLIYSVRNCAAHSVDKAAICSYPDCDIKSIKNSHTIQRSGSLKEISESGHLVSPTGRTHKDSWLGKVGYNKASVFAGFCQSHENIFQEFEANKDFKHETQIGLQLFRTICREISVIQEVRHSFLKLLDVYVRFRNRKLDEMLNLEMERVGLDMRSSIVKNTSYKFNNGVVRYIKNHLKSTRKYLCTLDRLKTAVFKDITSGRQKHFYYYAVNIDLEIPVCLAGRGGIRFKYGSESRKIDIIINVLPLKGKTYLIAGSFRKHKKYIKEYVERYLGSPFNLLVMVESWMLYGSDHWFLKPSVWNALDDTTKKKIHHELYISQKNIAAYPDIMIFKECRSEIINMYKSLGSEYAVVASQLEKLMNDHQ